MWKAAGGMFRDHQVLGTGPGGYSLNYLEYSARLQEAGAARPAYAGITQDAHNDWIQTLAERGLLGAVLLFGVLGVMAAAALRGLSGLAGSERITRAAALGALAAIGVEALFGFPMRIFPTAALAVWLLALVVPLRPVTGRMALVARAGVAAWSITVLLLAGRLLVADAYLRAGNDAPDGTGWYARGLNLLPSHGELHFRNGLTLVRAGRGADAEREFTAALPGFRDPDVWFNLGSIALGAKRYPDAVERFRAGLRLYPFFKAAAWADLAEAEWGAGSREEARRAAESALGIEPANAHALAVVEKLGGRGRRK
jgi:tetratricopeptide (TPR) repeat protein